MTTYSNSIDQSGQFSEEEVAKIRKALGLNHYHAGMNLSYMTHEVPMFNYNDKTKSFEQSEYQIYPTGTKTCITNYINIYIRYFMEYYLFIWNKVRTKYFPLILLGLLISVNQ